MKNSSFWLFASLLLGVLLTAACSNSDNPEQEQSSSFDEKISDGTAVNPSSMYMSVLSGFILEPDGTPIQNVKVTSGSESCLSGPDGGFVLDKVNSVNGRTVVNFNCNGYFDLVRSMPTVSGDVWEVTMIPTWGSNENVISTYERVSNELSASTTSGMKIELPAYGLKYADDDSPISSSSWVDAQILYLNPDDDNFATMMPGGDLAAIRTDNSQAQLVSYGMVNVSLSINGNKAQLADGKPATLTFPVPEKFKDNKPSEIPLWSFDETNGIWKEEGVATYNSQDDVYEGQVTHFSWVNLDYPESRATLKINVKDQAGNVIPNQAVNIDGQTTYYTDAKGVIECYVPINTDFYVTVRSIDYSNYSPEVKVNVSKLTSAGATKTIDIVLPTMAHVSGKVVNGGKGNNLSSLWIEYGINSTKAVHTDANGQFILNAPFDYKGAAKLVVLASDGSTKKFDINLDGKDHAYTINIKTDKSTGGTVKYTPTGGATETLVVAPMFASDVEGVQIVDDALSIYAGSITLMINNYSDSKSTYNDAYVSLSTVNSVMDNAANVKVTKNEYNNYTFQVNGKGKNERWNNGVVTYENVGTYEGEFSAPLLGKGNTFKPVTKKESFFPSFTPWIDGKDATVGLRLTDCQQFGTGVLLWFYDNDLNYDDYKAFKALAQQSLGDPIESHDDGPDEYGYQDMCISYFYKDGKFIMVSYCPWREVEPEELDYYSTMGISALRDNHSARIQVHALEGLTTSPDELIMVHWK